MTTLSNIRGFAPALVTVQQPEPAASLNPRPYVGVFAGSGAVWAFEYLGGEYVSQLATKSLTGTGLTAADASWAILSASPLVVAWQRSGKVLVWNITANTFAGPSSALPSFAGEITSGGRDGFAYFPEADGVDYFALWKVGTDAALTQVTGAGLESITPLDGLGLSTLFWTGSDGFVVVSDFGTGDGGYVTVSGGQSTFTLDNDWLPGTPDADWGGWNNNSGPRVPGQSYAIGILPNGASGDRYLIKVPSPASDATVLIDGADFGGETPGRHCDPSPDGVTAVIGSVGKVAQVSLTTPAAPEWLDVDDAPPVTDKPHAFFCLD